MTDIYPSRTVPRLTEIQPRITFFLFEERIGMEFEHLRDIGLTVILPFTYFAYSRLHLLLASKARQLSTHGEQGILQTHQLPSSHRSAHYLTHVIYIHVDPNQLRTALNGPLSV